MTVDPELSVDGNVAMIGNTAHVWTKEALALLDGVLLLPTDDVVAEVDRWRRGGRHRSHFATCPHVEVFRRRCDACRRNPCACPTETPTTKGNPNA
jgi:hypothetical protein